MLLVGCYSLEPARGIEPVPGMQMGFDITDAGRVALGGLMGPEIAQIEGRLTDKSSTEYTIAVSEVHLLRGGDQVWHGETVHLKREYVSGLYERRFSKSRSLAMGAAGVAVIAAIAKGSLAGLSNATRPEPNPGDTAHTVRRPARP
jgi:hypothetical protein